MTPDSPDSFRFAYSPGAIRYGDGAAGALAAELASHDVERSLVVTGRTVGDSAAVMDPVREGLGDRLAGVFAETTPDKRLSTAIAAAEAVDEADADGLVAVGGGSSLDVASVARVVAASDLDGGAIAEELLAERTITVPDGTLPPLVAVPTTLAGAELSQGAGITVDPTEHGDVADGSGRGDRTEPDERGPISGSVSDPRLMPSAIVADPALYATTPRSVLTGSAMNGFDKGIETIYAKRATPVTDATAVRGLELLREGLPGMAANAEDRAALGTVVRGTLLVQYATSRPDGSTLSVIHAFGHALRDYAGLQQGVAHAVVAPHALAYVLEQVDGRRELLAGGLGVPIEGKTDAEIADEVVAAVADVRDALGLPRALADVDGIAEAELDDVARLVLNDGLWENAPAGIDPTPAAIERILRRAHEP